MTKKEAVGISSLVLALAGIGIAKWRGNKRTQQLTGQCDSEMIRGQRLRNQKNL